MKALAFAAAAAAFSLSAAAASSAAELRTAVFAGGCFWSAEHDAEHLPGVKAVVVGYAGGKPTTTGPNYMDPIGGYNAAAATLTALRHRQISGLGQYVEVPQVEAAMQFIGPELLLGELPQEVRGTSRIRRDGLLVWEEEFLSGEAHMSHSIANLEHYHFRYPMHRRPGDLHAYFFGAAVMSFAFGVKTLPGDEYEIEASLFGKPLKNRMEPVPDEGPVRVTPL